MTDQNLTDLRNSCERGLTPLSVMNIDGGTTLVILQGLCENDYSCHRYFKMGDSWHVSYDGQRIPLENVWKWLSNPCAESARATAEAGR